MGGVKIFKIFIYPPNSLIMADIIERLGHEPLTMMTEIEKRATNVKINLPPLNITDEEPRRGLKYAAVEVPSGVRGRLAIAGALIEKADAAIILEEAEFGFGCTGCARTNALMKFLIKQRNIPCFTVEYPRNREAAKRMIKQIAEFLKSLEAKS